MLSASTISIRRPIQFITGTAIELPITRYRGPSAVLALIFVQPSSK